MKHQKAIEVLKKRIQQLNEELKKSEKAMEEPEKRDMSITRRTAI